MLFALALAPDDDPLGNWRLFEEEERLLLLLPSFLMARTQQISFGQGAKVLTCTPTLLDCMVIAVSLQATRSVGAVVV